MSAASSGSHATRTSQPRLLPRPRRLWNRGTVSSTMDGTASSPSDVRGAVKVASLRDSFVFCGGGGGGGATP